MKAPTAIRGLSCFTVAAFFFLCTIEICSRIDDAVRFGAPLWGRYNADSLRGKDSDGIPCNVPNACYQKWRNNSYGFRGPASMPESPPGAVRVVCLGASESYGLYETPGKEWPAQLSGMLSGPKYQVVNASVVGLPLHSYTAYLRKHVLPLKPDIVVCFINPLFSAVRFERTRENKSSSAPTVTAIQSAGKDNPETLLRRIVSTARALPRIKQALKDAMAKSFPSLLRRYQLANLQRQLDDESIRLRGCRPKNVVSEESVANFREEIAKLVAFLESQKVKVLLSTYPSLIDRENLTTYPEIFCDSRRFSIEFSLQGMIDVLEKYNAVIREVAARSGTMFVDCRSIVPKSDKYFGDNVHYTDQGARLVAEVIASQIIGKSCVTSFTSNVRELELK